MRWVMGYIAALSVLAFIISVSIAFPAFFTPFYNYQYDKRQTAETINIEKDKLMEVTEHLLDYMKGKRADLNLTITVAGQEREFFSQREKDHMADVLDLLNSLFMVRNIAFWLLLLIIIAMSFLKYEVRFILARCCREVLACFLILSILLTIIISLDFNRAFTLFHLMFFRNDLWLLDPAVDLLINMVPEGFFIDITIFIAFMVLSLSLAVIGWGSWYLYKTAYLSKR